jgi:hypothetical protein
VAFRFFVVCCFGLWDEWRVYVWNLLHVLLTVLMGEAGGLCMLLVNLRTCVANSSRPIKTWGVHWESFVTLAWSCVFRCTKSHVMDARSCVMTTFALCPSRLYITTHQVRVHLLPRFKAQHPVKDVADSIQTWFTIGFSDIAAEMMESWPNSTTKAMETGWVKTYSRISRRIDTLTKNLTRDRRHT